MASGTHTARFYAPLGLKRSSGTEGFFGREKPRYPALAAAILFMNARVQAALADLGRAMFRAVGLPVPTFGERGASLWRGRLKVPGRELTFAEEQALDAAIQRFIAEMVGPPDREGGGLVQEMAHLAHRVGAERGAEQLHLNRPPVPQTDPVRRRLEAQAFERLAENGRFRFGDRLEEIKERLHQGFRDGDGPITIARELAEGFTVERHRWETLARTEMAFAAERGLRDELRAEGIQQVEYIGNPGADEECASRVGQIYHIDDEDNLPPRHPNCLCSCVPVVPSAE